jgi:hypothetical protein
MASRTAVGAPRTRIAAHGLRVALPERWEARLYRRDGVDDSWAGESNNPVLHLGNFALPPGRGDFGTGAVEVMGDGHAFVSLLEYDREEAGRPLFAASGRPRLTLRDFAANALQRRLPGQLGVQRFFTENGRPFCLYVVLGSRGQAAALVDEVNRVLDGVRIDGLDEGAATAL